MDSLTSASLEWALTHIERFGDTDIFPVPFEYAAIRHGWTGLRTHLEGLDLSAYAVRPARRMLVPKPGIGFRVAAQLDPIDSLIYAAVVYEAATAIEASRIPSDQRIACSYRLQPDAQGALFAAESGWPDFHARSEELLAQSEHSYVLTADISDFYNQIYHHRVRNALESAGVTSDRAQHIESFLLNLTARQSRGLPVGPIASIALAEICLNDVDSHLLHQGRAFVRYVDDFRIFCDSPKTAIHALHELTEYLFTAHRLSLQSIKTRIFEREQFRREELNDPAQIEERSKVSRLKDLIANFQEMTGYTISLDDLNDADVRNETRENLLALFETCLDTERLHLGLARYILRRATRMRTRVLYGKVFANLDALSPVVRDVALYIQKSISDEPAIEWGPQFVRFLDTGNYGDCPFVREWGLATLRNRPTLSSEAEIWRLSEQSQNSLGLRPLALAAREFKRIDWMRSQKEVWANHNPWDRRAVIWCGAILPRDERRSWLGMIANSADPLDRVVAQYALSIAEQT